jgi:hypothetical protein
MGRANTAVQQEGVSEKQRQMALLPYRIIKFHTPWGAGRNE